MPPASSRLLSLVFTALLATMLSLSSSTSVRADLDDCLDGYKELSRKPKFRAMAVTDVGAWCSWVWSAPSQKQANSEALLECKKRGNDCRLLDTEKDINTLQLQLKQERDRNIADIRDAQTRLKTLGLYLGNIDGRSGPATVSAIKKFQRTFGLTVDGSVNQSLLAKLKSAVRTTRDLCGEVLDTSTMTLRDGQNSYHDYAEAQRRGLSAEDCRRALGISIEVPIQSYTTSKSTADDLVCKNALNATRDNWDERAPYLDQVVEAKRRGLSVENCRIIIGLGPLPRPSTAVSTSVGLREGLCAEALNSARSAWSNKESATEAVLLAKRLNLDVSDCRVVLGLPRGTYASEDLQTEKIPLENPNGTISGVDLAKLSDSSLCRGAYSPARMTWEQSSMFEAHVAEAKRRGLTVDDCRMAIGLAQLPSQNANQGIDSICLSALNGRKTAWETIPRFSDSVAEAVRRGLSVDDCRAAIGLAPLESAATQNNSSAQVIPQSAKTQLSLRDICEQSLNTEKSDWSSSVSATEARKQADALGISVEDCRVKLGLSVTQQPVAIAPEATDKIPPSTDSSTSLPASPHKKVALVIGNSAYEHSPELANPHNDAEAVANALTALGFEVISGLDLNNAATELKVREFAKAAKTADLSLFYYAGHGLQIGGENYIVPVDAKVEDETAVSFELINVATITNFMGGMDKVGIILLDACRDNPFSRSLKRSLSASRAASVDQGLAPIAAEGGGLFVAFSTAPGDVAADGDGMTNSPFTTALLKHLPTKGLEINTVMTRVKAEVAKMTKNDQRPWTNSDLTTEVYLVPTP